MSGWGRRFTHSSWFQPITAPLWLYWCATKNRTWHGALENSRKNLNSRLQFSRHQSRYRNSLGHFLYLTLNGTEFLRESNLFAAADDFIVVPEKINKMELFHFRFFVITNDYNWQFMTPSTWSTTIDGKDTELSRWSAFFSSINRNWFCVGRGRNFVDFHGKYSKLGANSSPTAGHGTYSIDLQYVVTVFHT